MFASLASSAKRKHGFVLGLWLLALAAAICMAIAFSFAVDAKTYERTIRDVRTGNSPYVSGIARLQLKHARNSEERILNYIYPPATLLLVRAAGWLPVWFRYSAYWVFYVAGVWILLWCQERCLYKKELRVFLYLSPLCAFFPGLLNDDFLLSGNIGPILYGLISVAVLRGYKQDRWSWFYWAVLFASLFKPPMLTLLVIPPLTVAGQWRKAAGIGLLGGLLFLSQNWIWHESFQRYLQMMNLEFLYNQEFGFGPAGMLGEVLLNHGHSYQKICTTFYLFYATGIFLLLRYYSRHYFAGHLSIREWMPVLLIGVLLLNPRIRQYDAEAVTLPMAIMAWRFLEERVRGKRYAAILASILFAVSNAFAAFANAWNATESILIVTIFSLSIWRLHQKIVRVQAGLPVGTEPQAA